MNRITYELVEETASATVCSDSPVTTYGVAAYAADSAARRLVAVVPDITADRNRLAEFVRSCNRLSLSPLHLADAIEDFLAG